MEKIALLPGGFKPPHAGHYNAAKWLAVNTVDFFNEVSLLFGLVAAEGSEMFTSKGEGFPTGFEYRWADGVTIKKPIRCSSPEYVDYVIKPIAQTSLCNKYSEICRTKNKPSSLNFRFNFTF